VNTPGLYIPSGGSWTMGLDQNAIIGVWMPPTVWSGMIDELRIWDVVLNLTQIQELQYVGSDSSCTAQEPHLQVLYNFNTFACIQ